MSESNQVILEISELIANQEYLVKCKFNKEPVKHRCLGKNGSDDKVYMTRADSAETPDSMVEKFKNNQMPSCFVVWDYMLKGTYEITAL